MKKSKTQFRRIDRSTRQIQYEVKDTAGANRGLCKYQRRVINTIDPEQCAVVTPVLDGTPRRKIS